MVLFLTNNGPNENNSYEILAKQMVNIENNLNIYKVDGTLNEIPFKKNNIYNYNDVEFEINFNIGVILIYNKVEEDIVRESDSSIYENIIRQLKNKLNDIDEDINNIIDIRHRYMPFNLNEYRSTNHTIIQNKISNSRGRNEIYLRGFVLSDYEIKKTIKKHRFVWIIKQLNNHNIKNDWYLLVSEYEKFLSKQYLLKSINTIIFDKIGLFNVDNGLNQINYPLISQYSCYNKNIFDISISVSDIYNIDYEIASMYMSDITNDINNTRTKYSTITMKELNMYKIKNPNTDIKWYKQLADVEIENIDKSDTEYKDICFVSRMPLYDKVYLLDVGMKISKIKKLDNGDVIKDISIYNESHILVSAYVFHAIYSYNDKLISFSEYLLKLTKYSILNILLVKYNISKYTAIKGINNKLYSNILQKHKDDKQFHIKKNILLNICKYGIYETNNKYLREKSYITINPNKNKLFIGKTMLTDSHIQKIMATNVFIYKINVLV